MKKLLYKFLICLSIFIFVFNTVVFGDDTIYTEGSFNYVIDDEGSIQIVRYFGNDKEVEVPRSIGFYEENGEIFPHMVTSIAKGTFDGIRVDKIILPDTIVFIEDGAINNNIEINYYNGEGTVISEKEDEPDPIIIEPQNENENVVINGSDDDYIEYEEIEIGKDEFTGKQETIEEISEIENNNDLEEITIDSNEISSSNNTSKVVVIIILFIGVGLYFVISKKNNKSDNIK